MEGFKIVVMMMMVMMMMMMMMMMMIGNQTWLLYRYTGIDQNYHAISWGGSASTATSVCTEGCQAFIYPFLRFESQLKLEN